jgi:PKD repeat protein
MVRGKIRKSLSAIGVICMTPFLMGVAQPANGNLFNLEIIRPGCSGNDGKIILTQSEPGLSYEVKNTYMIQVASGTNFLGTDTIEQLIPGTYTVRIFNQEFSESKEITLIGATPVTADFTPSATTIFAGESITFTNQSSGGSDYAWDFGDGFVYYGVAAPTHPFYTPGTYNVMLQAVNKECMTSKSTQITVLDRVNSVSTKELDQIKMFASGKSLFVEGNMNGNLRLEMFNLLGQNMKSEVLVPVNGQSKANLQDLQSGYYIAKISDEEGRIATQKIFVK